ncbi:MAG: outer membrane protein assembly factor BamC [Burkholderiales bacterium]|nr:outer membrane protein assembly factor BamC [Burkholderiales bacterium]
MKPPFAATRAHCAVIALAVLLAGCSSIEEFLAGDRVDYQSTTVRPKPLEIPPDLTQLQRDPRYAPQGGVISASSTAQTPQLLAGSSTMASVAPATVGDIRVEKQGHLRWLVAQASPEVLYPQIKDFWEERGFRLTTDKPQAGVMETDWVENRAKLPNDLIRSTLGRLVDRLYDSGERDRFRTRLERGVNGTEIYITHRGLEEVYVTELKDSTAWRPRDNDPQLEAELLAQLMAKLGAQDRETARAAVAAAPEMPARARALAEPSTLEVDDPFDRAWRRVGLALDRSGFTVEDRDRNAGTYYVRYVDPKTAVVDEPNFFARLFGAKGPNKDPVRYRVVVKAGGSEKSTVTVQTAAGAAENSEAGKTIVARLVSELR